MNTYSWLIQASGVSVQERSAERSEIGKEGAGKRKTGAGNRWVWSWKQENRD
jgi:hypothetical protein